MTTNPHDIVPAHLAVQAMRDNGYKNAAYAIAELMDNSIQAGATEVQLLCGEKQVLVDQRRSSRIYKLAVLDNGCGMDATVLRLALQFGNGTYLDAAKHIGIGRFGMGLPSSSVSQCQKVEVWSWQNGTENAIYTYLDLEEIKQQRQTEVPEPQPKAIPNIWQRVSNSFGQSGTLVVWSNIDKCIWRTGKAIIDNSELLIGRMYRRFLDSGRVSIRMTTFDYDNLTNIIIEKYALPNDPGYLIARTSCPPPYDSTSMFQYWEGKDTYEVEKIIDFRGQQHAVKIRFSYAKDQARQPLDGKQPGSLPHGQHAAKNVGISVVRAERELELDKTLVSGYDPTDRWWGIEVEFPPALDDLFGVTNNKQSARNFSELLSIDIESLLKDGKTITQLKSEFEEDGDPRGPLLEISQKIKSQLRIIRSCLDAQTKGRRGNLKRHSGSKAEEVATAVTQERKKEGHTGESDKQELLSKQERQEVIEKTLTDEGLTENQAVQLAATTIDDGLKYIFAEADLETPAFFSVKPRGGAIIVTLNTNHPAYKNLVEILEKDVDGVDPETLRYRLTNSLEGLKLLLMAWARYEDEQPDGKRRQAAQDTRVDWGRIARQFLEKEE
ncbi:ATP-binding protein [Nostoc parmelioides]|uniref:ATP-binding protein n=1 Tax=Nostoc parmelioides FACHB-3921 TaxID=2692909 RepID=A0ABR8BNC7_9NOSO|nr:ATP-binding protein [Nostoc parmelioides]MBD2255305.1 ATP-binding protein [Nostoc parmelioides FACHB-3921]